jgi:hypothetical protein
MCAINFVISSITIHNTWCLLLPYVKLKLQFDIKVPHILHKCQINIKLQC